MRQPIATPRQLGEILRARRKARRMAQRQVADTLAISQSRLSILEANPAALTLDRLLTLCAVLGLRLIVQDAADAAHGEAEW